MAALVGQCAAFHCLNKDFAGFRIVAWRRVRTNPEVTQFGRAAPYTSSSRPPLNWSSIRISSNARSGSAKARQTTNA